MATDGAATRGDVPDAGWREFTLHGQRFREWDECVQWYDQKTGIWRSSMPVPLVVKILREKDTHGDIKAIDHNMIERAISVSKSALEDQGLLWGDQGKALCIMWLAMNLNNDFIINVDR